MNIDDVVNARVFIDSNSALVDVSSCAAVRFQAVCGTINTWLMGACRYRCVLAHNSTLLFADEMHTAITIPDVRPVRQSVRVASQSL